MLEIVLRPRSFFRSYQSTKTTLVLAACGYAVFGVGMFGNVQIHEEEPLEVSFVALVSIVSIFTLSAFFGFLAAHVGAKLLGGGVSLRRSLESVGLAFLPAGFATLILAAVAHQLSPDTLASEVLWCMVIGCCVWAFAIVVVAVAVSNRFGPVRVLGFVAWFASLIAAIVWLDHAGK